MGRLTPGTGDLRRLPPSYAVRHSRPQDTGTCLGEPDTVARASESRRTSLAVAGGSQRFKASEGLPTPVLKMTGLWRVTGNAVASGR